jgi:hypothetical protein
MLGPLIELIQRLAFAGQPKSMVATAAAISLIYRSDRCSVDVHDVYPNRLRIHLGNVGSSHPRTLRFLQVLWRAWFCDMSKELRGGCDESDCVIGRVRIRWIGHVG